jgi:hypothetical protein
MRGLFQKSPPRRGRENERLEFAKLPSVDFQGRWLQRVDLAKKRPHHEAAGFPPARNYLAPTDTTAPGA